MYIGSVQILCYLHKGLAHLWILLFMGNPEINSPQIMRDDYILPKWPSWTSVDRPALPRSDLVLEVFRCQSHEAITPSQDHLKTLLPAKALVLIILPRGDLYYL